MEFKLNEYHRNVSDEELIEDVKRVAELLKKETLSCKDYSSHGRFSYNTVRNRFGSWNEVLRRAGLSIEKGRLKFHDYCESDEEFFADLRRVAKLMGRGYVTRTEYEKHGRFNYGERAKKYGGWKSLLKVAGLEQTPFRTGPKQMYSEKELFEEIERVWIKLGRQPSSTDFEKKEFKYGRNTFLRRFGGWRKALEAFVNYINTDDTEIINDTTDEDRNINSPDDNKSSCYKHKTKREPSSRLKVQVLMRDGNRCRICGVACNDGIHKIHFDHIIPWSKGGETTLENLQVLCSDCNEALGNIDK